MHSNNTYIISHSGILGQKWGTRRYQNPDGTWTEEGKAIRRSKYVKSNKNGKTSEKKVKLTDEEISEKRRKALEDAEYEAKLAEFKKRKIEADTRIEELSHPRVYNENKKTALNAIGGFLGRTLGSFTGSFVSKVGENFARKIFKLPPSKK